MAKKEKEVQKTTVLDTIKNVNVPQVLGDIKDKVIPKKKKSFRKAHPFLYILACVGQVILLLLPLAAWLLITLYIFPVERSGLLTIGGAGTFLIGVGLLNLTMRCFGKFQYLGCATMLCLTVGGMLTALASLMVYTPQITRHFDESMVSSYMLSIAAILFYFIVYGLVFRAAVQRSLRNRDISRWRIKKLKKGGLRNYWWYADLHEEIGLGAAYSLNIMFTVLFFAAAMMNVFFGWMSVFRYVTGGLLTAAGVLCVIMMFWSLARGRKNNKFGTWLVGILWILLSIGVTGAAALMTAGLLF